MEVSVGGREECGASRVEDCGECGRVAGQELQCGGWVWRGGVRGQQLRNLLSSYSEKYLTHLMLPLYLVIT